MIITCTNLDQHLRSGQCLTCRRSAILGTNEPGGMIRKYSLDWALGTLRSPYCGTVCNNIQAGLSMRSIPVTDGMRHIVTWHNWHQCDTRQDWCPVMAWMMTSTAGLSSRHTERSQCQSDNKLPDTPLLSSSNLQISKTQHSFTYLAW